MCDGPESLDTWSGIPESQICENRLQNPHACEFPKMFLWLSLLSNIKSVSFHTPGLCRYSNIWIWNDNKYFVLLLEIPRCLINFLEKVIAFISSK